MTRLTPPLTPRLTPRLPTPHSAPPQLAPQLGHVASSSLTPSQRTAGTARIVVTAGLLIVLEAAWRGSVTRAMMAVAMLALGAGLLVFAKRAD